LKERLQAFPTPPEIQTSKYRGKTGAWIWANLLGLLLGAQWWQSAVARDPALELKTGTRLKKTIIVCWLNWQTHISFGQTQNVTLRSS